MGRRSLSINLMLGGVVRGMLVISGGDGSIGFSVEDSTGKNVIPENRASHRYFFEFRPDKKDSYVLLLDNGDDSAEKSVYWIVWAYYYNLVFLLLGAALSVAGIFTMYREERIISSKVKNTLEEACKIVKTSMNSR